MGLEQTNTERSRARTAGLGLALCAALLWTACGTAPRSVERTEAADGGIEAGSALTGFRLRVFEDNALENVLRAERAVMNVRTRETKLEDVSVLFFTSGTVTGKLKSDEGILYILHMEDEPGVGASGQDGEPQAGISRRDFVLRGNVDLAWENLTVRTPGMRYSRGTPDTAFTSEGGAFDMRMQTPQGELVCSGERFQASEDLAKLRFDGPGNLRIGSQTGGAPAGDKQEKKG